MAESESVGTNTKREVVQGAARLLRDYYVFPDRGEAMSEALITSLGSGRYDGPTSPEEFCAHLTTELQTISQDKHVRVRFNEEPRPVTEVSTDYAFTPEERRMWTDAGRRVNFGFYKVERLGGNVGFLDLRNFWEVSLEGAGETAVGAMQLILHTDALIIDLRQNGGGSPSMVSFLISYLLSADPVHLNSFYDRGSDKTTQSWTVPFVPGRRTPDKPVYLLIGEETFSGAEEFAYNLKTLGRARIVGEATGGGAHPGRDISVTPHYRVFVPLGRPINPISKTNWEGVGVAPDISVPASQAFNHAYRLALQDVLDQLAHQGDEANQQKAEATRVLTELDLED